MARFTYAPIAERDGRSRFFSDGRVRAGVLFLGTVAAVALVFAAVAGGGHPARSFLQSVRASSAPTGSLSSSAVRNPPSFRTYNSYTETNPITWFLEIDNAPATWAHLAEPYRESTFVANPETAAGEDGFSYDWRINGAAYEGKIVAHTFTAVGTYEVKLRQTNANTREVISVAGVVTVKYVRREIRALTEDDRNRFLDAMQTLYRLPTSVGTDLYGPEYRSIEYFVQVHLNGAGVTDCDHWHDDAGIMTHHVGFTLQFEQSLQLVDPSVSIPYWEYTMDEYLYGKSPTAVARNSPIFGDDWFGEMSPNNALHTVTRGRWAYTSVATGAWEHVHNSHGLLRAPWNTDPTPYVTRHDMVDGAVFFNFVSCSTYHSCFAATSLSVMNECLNGGTHGPVHIIVGGSWGAPDEAFMRVQGFSSIHLLVSKALWRRGYLRYPESCAADDDDSVAAADGRTGSAKNVFPYMARQASTKDAAAASSNSQRRSGRRRRRLDQSVGRLSGGNAAADVEKGEEGCKTSCPAALLAANNLTAYDVLLDTQALFWSARYSFGHIYYDSVTDLYRVAGIELDDDATDAFWERMLAALCNAGHVGEMYTPSAPYDPIFWILHPAAERLLGARRLLGRSAAAATAATAASAGEGGDDNSDSAFDETWGYTHKAWVAGDMGVVCDWDDVREFTDLPKCTQATCGGHSEDDVLPFLFSLGGETGVKLTNAELLALTVPTNDALPYMYADYDWDWCGAQGIDLPFHL